MSAECGMYRSTGESFEMTTLAGSTLLPASSTRRRDMDSLALSLSISHRVFKPHGTQRKECRISLSRVERGVRAPDADCGACR